MTIKLKNTYPYIYDIENRNSKSFKVAKDSCFYFAFLCGLQYDSFTEFQIVRFYSDYHIQSNVAFALEAGFIAGRHIKRLGYDRAKKVLKNFRYKDIIWE